MGRKISRCILITVLLLFVTFTFCVTVYCAGPTKIYIDPPEIVDPTLEPGEIFIINVCIANVSGLSDYEFKMSYNTVTLTCIGVEVAPTDHMPATNWEIDDYRGNVWVNVTYSGSVTTGSAVTVASLTFVIQRQGTSILDLYYTNLVDSSGQPIPHKVSDGYFSSGSPYDLNKDGRVDIGDIVIVAAAFGSAAVDDPTTPINETRNWNPIADLNGDGKVDIFDLVLVSIHFGER